MMHTPFWKRSALVGFIKFQLIASFAIILICTIISGLFSYRIMEREMTRFVINDNNKFLELYSQTINSLVVSNSNEIYLKILSDSATMDPIRKYVSFPLSGNIVDTYEVHNYLKSIKDSNKHLLSVEILYSDNNLLISSNRILYDLFYDFRKAELEPYDLLLTLSSQKKGEFLYLVDGDVLTITKPIVSGQRINALCIINYSLSSLKDYLNEMMPLELSNIFVIDSGQVLFNVNESFDFPGSPDNFYDFKNTPNATYIKDIENEKYVFSYKDFGKNKLSFLSVSRSKIYTEPIRYILNSLFTSVVFTLIAGIIFSFIMLKWQIRPMKYLVMLCSSLGRTKDKNIKTGNTYEYITSTITHLADVAEKNTRELETIMPVLRDNFIFWLLNERPEDESEVFEKLKHMKVEFQYRYFTLIAVKVAIIKDEHDTFENEISSARMRVKLENIFNNQNCLYKLYNNNGMILGFINSDNEINKVSELNIPGCSVYFAISGLEENLVELSVKTEKIIDMLKFSYIYPEINDLSNKGDFNDINDDILWSFLKRIINYLRIEEFENAVAEMNAFTTRIRQYGCSSNFIDKMIYNFCMKTDSLKNIEEKYIKDIVKAFEGSRNVISLRDRFNNILEKIEEYKKNISENTGNKLVVLAKEYIKENFTDTQISLQTVADVLNVSPTHLSHIFSETEGVTFVEYLKYQKLEYGRKLLIETELTLDEIARKLNYSSSQYFITLFRKQFGATPSTYRKKYL